MFDLLLGLLLTALLLRAAARLPERCPRHPARSQKESLMKIAVVGAGISGLSAAWLLNRQHDVTLFEAGDYLGGHTHTVDIESLGGTRFPVDTGFLVFNHRTYPNLTALFRELKVDTVASDMSFAVSMAEPELEWAGSSLATLFAQKRNLARPGFWRMLQDTLRFNRETAAALPDVTLGDYLVKRERYSAEFRDWYLLPMAAAIWSCPTQAMLDYPLTTFVRFARNHGLLQIVDRPQWQTVRGGGREYVERIAATLSDVRLATPVKSVLRDADGVWLGLPGGDCERFDEVVLACHSDQALALLGSAASAAERRILGAIRYQPNRAVLHTDARLLPREPRVWSAWNYMAGARRQRRRTAGQRLLPDQPPAALADTNAGRRLAQPAHRARSGQGDRRLGLRPSAVRPGGHRRPGPTRCHPGRRAPVVLRRLGRLRLPRGRPLLRAGGGEPPRLPRPLAGRDDRARKRGMKPSCAPAP
jgi:predicted NAD/FAD-binding protein